MAALCPLRTTTLWNTLAATLHVSMHLYSIMLPIVATEALVLLRGVYHSVALCKRVSPRPNTLCVSKLLRAPWCDALLVIVKVINV